MKRLIYDELVKWKESNDRKPLIIRGVRQCGKTWILNEFGTKNYEDIVYFNFEGNNELKEIFSQNLDTNRIIEELSIFRK